MGVIIDLVTLTLILSSRITQLVSWPFSDTSCLSQVLAFHAKLYKINVLWKSAKKKSILMPLVLIPNLKKSNVWISKVFPVLSIHAHFLRHTSYFSRTSVTLSATNLCCTKTTPLTFVTSGQSLNPGRMEISRWPADDIVPGFPAILAFNTIKSKLHRPTCSVYWNGRIKTLTSSKRLSKIGNTCTWFPEVNT